MSLIFLHFPVSCQEKLFNSVALGFEKIQNQCCMNKGFVPPEHQETVKEKLKINRITKIEKLLTT